MPTAARRCNKHCGCDKAKGWILGRHRRSSSDESSLLPVVPLIPESQLGWLARALGECGTGDDISRVLADQRVVDKSGKSTKWRRLYWAFGEIQRQDRSANRILAFIQSYLAPARFVGRTDEFEKCREELNARLSFAGLEYGKDGKFRRREAAQTLSEAEARIQTIAAKFRGHRMPPEVLKYCRAELMEKLLPRGI